MNEAIYRSPKWLRNFVDFEVNTGDDIKGEPSKKAILKAWDERWKECDRSTFEIFYKEIYGKTGYLTSDELEKIRKTLRGDVSVWDKFDKWLPGHKQREKEKAERRREHERKEEERFRQRQKERREEERLRQERQREKENQESQRQKDLEKQLDNLYNLLISDFSANRYDDKISTPVINGEVTFHYTFENGEKFRMEGNKIYWRSSIYTVGLLIKALFDFFKKKKPVRELPTEILYEPINARESDVFIKSHDMIDFNMVEVDYLSTISKYHKFEAPISSSDV
jgi:hypothetical protein